MANCFPWVLKPRDVYIECKDLFLVGPQECVKIFGLVLSNVFSSSSGSANNEILCNGAVIPGTDIFSNIRLHSVFFSVVVPE